MRREKKLFAYGTHACINCSGTLRARTNACIQCNPAAVGFIRNHTRAKHIYIAGSRYRRILKIGSSSNPKNLRKRIVILNTISYAGASDWRLLCHVQLSNAAEVEHKLLDFLSVFSQNDFYKNGGQSVKSKECIRYDYSNTRDVLRGYLPLDRWFDLCEVYEGNEYEFYEQPPLG
jgi:hypothetical protein